MSDDLPIVDAANHETSDHEDQPSPELDRRTFLEKTIGVGAAIGGASLISTTSTTQLPWWKRITSTTSTTTTTTGPTTTTTSPPTTTPSGTTTTAAPTTTTTTVTPPAGTTSSTAPSTTTTAAPPAVNPIRLENAKPGTHDWRLARMATNNEICGYASATSVDRGGTIDLFVHCIEPSYTIEVFRMGWYGGPGGRQVLPPVSRTGTRQVIPAFDPDTGFLECNWTNPYALKLPTSNSDPTIGLSGFYLAKLTSQPSGFQSYIIFVVRDDNRAADHFVQSSVTTYQAYNTWGGKSLYVGPGGRGYKVSYNRPYDGMGAGHFFIDECEFVRYAEREGFDVKYGTNLDVHQRQPRSWNTKSYISIGHDEYWSASMRSNIEAARDAGIHLAFLGANDVYWQIRFETSALTRVADRTMVCYKDSLLDPASKSPSTAATTTVRWREVGRPEYAFMGVQFDDDYGHISPNYDFVVSDASHWMFAGTGLRNGDRIRGIIASEVDRLWPGSPSNLQVLGRSPLAPPGVAVDDRHIAHTVMQVAPSGAIVFSAATLGWTWGLDDIGLGAHTDIPPSAALQTMTRNLMKRFAS